MVSPNATTRFQRDSFILGVLQAIWPIEIDQIIFFLVLGLLYPRSLKIKQKQHLF